MNRELSAKISVKTTENLKFWEISHLSSNSDPMLLAFALFILLISSSSSRFSLSSTYNIYMKLFPWFLYFHFLLYARDMRWARKAKRLKNDENILSKKLIFNMIYNHDFGTWEKSSVQRFREPEHDSHFVNICNPIRVKCFLFSFFFTY
jgi:hypothetical protein